MRCFTCDGHGILCGCCGESLDRCVCDDPGEPMDCVDCIDERKLIKEMPSVEAIAKTIKIPVSKWRGQCFLIASQMVEHKVVKGNARYGHWTGNVSPKSMFHNKPLIHHGWIEYNEDIIIDPTRFEFEGKDPYIYIGYNDHYDLGGNQYRESTMKPCPPYNPEKTIKYAFSKQTREFMKSNGGSEDICLERAFWLANLPLSKFGKYAKAVYQDIDKAGFKGFVPVDNYLKVME